MIFWGSSEGSWSPGRPGPEDWLWLVGEGLGEGDSAASAAPAEAPTSRAAAAAPTRVVRRWITARLAHEAGRQVDDRLGQEAEDHADDGAHHQRLASLVTTDRPLG